jgi:hypothetical protein
MTEKQKQAEDIVNKIFVGVSPSLKIRGIISNANFQKGTVIERCPVILYPISQEPIIELTELTKYHFYWTKKYNAIALGFGSLYNHSYCANCDYSRNYKEKVMIFKTVKRVKEGEELTINYNNISDSKTQLAKEYGIKSYVYKQKIL